VDRDVVERNAGMPPFVTRPRLCSIGDVLHIVPGEGGRAQGRSQPSSPVLHSVEHIGRKSEETALVHGVFLSAGH
jgi:hypothetical protein